MVRALTTVAIALGSLTAYLLYDYIGEVERAQAGAVFLKLHPESSMAAGERIREGLIETVILPESFSDLSTLAIPDTPDNRRWLLERPAHRDIPSGALLQYDHFSDAPETRFSAKITPGMRAMTIAVAPTSAVAYFVEPGSRVDLVGTLEMSRQQNIEVEIPAQFRSELGVSTTNMPDFELTTVSKTLLQNVHVLAVGRATTRGSYLGSVEGGYGTITIEVTPEQAELLVFARGQLRDELTVLLRNPLDKEIPDLPVVSWDDLSID